MRVTTVFGWVAPDPHGCTLTELTLVGVRENAVIFVSGARGLGGSSPMAPGGRAARFSEKPGSVKGPSTRPKYYPTHLSTRA